MDRGTLSFFNFLGIDSHRPNTSESSGICPTTSVVMIYIRDSESLVNWFSKDWYDVSNVLQCIPSRMLNLICRDWTC